jgi:hypothetical protein
MLRTILDRIPRRTRQTFFEKAREGTVIAFKLHPRARAVKFTKEQTEYRDMLLETILIGEGYGQLFKDE